jgi:hypothetical protein
MDESDVQYDEHPEQKISPLRGITIDWNDENENAYHSICFNPEFDSNEIDESDRYDEKHDE